MSGETEDALGDVEGSGVVLLAALLAIPELGKVDDGLMVATQPESRLLQLRGGHKRWHRVLVPVTCTNTSLIKVFITFHTVHIFFLIFFSFLFISIYLFLMWS